jgi:hypothetical protein
MRAFNGRGVSAVTEDPPFPGGREILAWFGSLRALDRLDLITRVEARRQHLHGQILSATVVHASPIRSAVEAQRVVALEAFYRAALPLLNAEHLALRQNSGVSNDTAIKRHLDEFHREYDSVGPLVNAGDWRPLKQKWLAEIERVEPRKLHVTATDPMERMEQRLAAQGARARGRLFDTQRARNILLLVPDQSERVSLAGLDSEPLFQV